MTSNFNTGGIDLDSVFLALTGTKRADVNFDVAGIDISNRFEPYTTGTKASATNYFAGASDLSDLFQSGSVPLETIAWTTSAETVFTQSTTFNTIRTGIKLLADGTTQRTQKKTGVYVAWFDWLDPVPSVNGANYQWKWVRNSGEALDTTPGIEGSWINAGTDLTMEYSAGSSSNIVGEFTVTVRVSGDAGTEVARVITLQADTVL